MAKNKRKLLSTEAFMNLWKANENITKWKDFYAVFKAEHERQKCSIPTEHQINMRAIKIKTQMENAGYIPFKKPIKPRAEKKKPPTIKELLDTGKVKAKKKPKTKAKAATK